MLVKDISPGKISSWPDPLWNFQNQLLIGIAKPPFSFYSKCSFWKSNGTTSGTVPIVDLGNGTLSNGGRSISSKFYFLFDDRIHGYELWVTDGTQSATNMVADVMPGAEGSFPTVVAELNGRAIFTARFQPGARGLFITDGSASGTTMLRNASGTNFTSFQSRVLFTVYEGSTSSLWESDGTALGTQRLPGSPKDCYQLTRINDQLFISTYSNGDQLWVLNSENKFRKILPPNFCCSVSDQARMDSTLLFQGQDNLGAVYLWKTNGDRTSTTLVRKFGAHFFTFVASNNKVAILALRSRDGWVTNGTMEGTFALGIPYLGECVPFHGIFVCGAGPTGNVRLWRTDGSKMGTYLLR
jgi:ELWxxDGT repeat protein